MNSSEIDRQKKVVKINHGLWLLPCILLVILISIALEKGAKIVNRGFAEAVSIIENDKVCDSYKYISEKEIGAVAEALVAEKYTPLLMPNGKFNPAWTPTNEQTFSCLLGQKILFSKK